MRGSQSDNGTGSFEAHDAGTWKRTAAGRKRAPRSRLFLKRLLTSCCVIAILTNIAHAGTAHLPVGGDVAAGSASIASDGTNMLIDQTSGSAVINWDGFSIGQGHQVTFKMPDRSAAVLNRVTGGEGSTIAGTLTGNGQVYLVNPNGIAITHSGTVKVGGSFTASTIDIKDEDFLRGRRRFSGRSSGKIKNSGSIETEDGGFVALLSNNGVDDDGVINVPAGKVALGVGSEITLDPTGTGFMQIAAPSTLADPEGVTMSGKIRAEGGRVEIKASTAGKVVRNLVNMSGEVNVASVRKVGGTVIFDGGKGGVRVSGKVKASSQKKKGGTVRIGGDHILLAGADVDVKGKSGGAVSIGGGWHGAAVPGVTTAREALIDEATTISASGAKGRGGDVTVWSDENTQFRGLITSMGNGGDGGDVEISSHGTYRYDGHVNLLADGGKAGTLLLDPYNLTISSAADGNVSGFAATGTGANINIATLSSTLGTASVNVTTGSSGSEAGDITLSAPLTWNAATSLTLNAAGSLKLNANVTAAHSGASLNLISGGAGGITSTASLFSYNNLTITQTAANASGSIGNINGTGNVTYNGPAASFVGGIATPTMLFNQNTTIGGKLTINSGVLSVGGANTFTEYNVKTGAVMALDNSGVSRSITYWNGIYTTITGGGTVQKTGTSSIYAAGGTSTLAIAMDPGALIDVRGGTLTFGYNGISYTNNKSDLNVASGAFFQGSQSDVIFDKVTGSGTILSGNSTSTPNNFTVGISNGSSTFAGTLASNGTNKVNLIKSGTGTIALTGTDSHTGTTTVNGGTLKAGSTSGLSSNADLTVSAGAQVDLGGFSNTVTSLSGAGTVTNSGASTATLTAGGNNSSTTFSGVLQDGAGKLALTKTGTGTLTLSGANTHTGNTAVSAGTLRISGQPFFNVGRTTSIASGATLDLFNSANDLGSAISSLTGTGTLTLSGNSTLTQTVNTGSTQLTFGMTGGTLDLQGTSIFKNALSSINWGSNTASLNIGATAALDLADGNTAIFSGLTGSGTITKTAGTGATGLTVGLGNVSTTYSGTIGSVSGTVTLTKQGTGTLTLGGNDTYSGSLAIQGGTVKAASATALGSGMAVSVASGTTLDLGGNSGTVGSLTGAGTITSSSAGDVTLDTGAANTSTSFTGTVQNGSGTVNLTKSGSGTFTLSGNNSYTGATTVNGGTLQAGSANAFGSGSATTVATGTTLDLAGNSLTLGSLAGGGTVTNSSSSAATLTAGGSNASTTFSGSLQNGTGTLALTKTGTGTLTLSGVNTETGTTTVNGGTLNLAGSWNLGAGTANTAVASGATLSGTGVLTAGSFVTTGAGTVSLTGANKVDTASATGTVGSYTLTNSKSISLGSISSSGTVSVQATGSTSDLTIGAGATIASSATGDAIKLGAGRNFFNNRGAGALSASSGRWLLFLPNATGSNFNNLNSGNTAVWNTSWGTSPGQTGNRYVFAAQPTLTVTSGSASKTYGVDATASIANTYTVSGYDAGVANAYLGDSAATALTGSAAVTSSGAAGNANAGTYGMTATQNTLASTSGYGLAFASTGQLTVDKANLTITGANTGITYDATAKTNGFSTSGLLFSDTVTSVLGRASGTNAGSYSDTLSGATGTGLSNYNIAYVNGGLTISRANLTVSGGNTALTYNGAARTNTFGTSGLFGTDSVTSVSGLASGTNAGSYTDNLSGATGSGLSNYNISYANGGLTIGKANLTIRGTTTNLTYDATARTNGYTTSGLVASDTVTSISGRATGTNAGSYADALSGATGTGLSNYNIAYVNGGMTIHKANLTVTGGNTAQAYNGTTRTNTFGTTGLFGPDSVSAVSGLATGINAGSYADNLSGATGSGLSNYNIAYVNGGLTVNRAGLTITGGNRVATYDTTAKTNTYGVAGLFGTDSVTGVTGRASGTNAGSYADNLSGATGSGLSNYDIAYVNGGLTINRAGLTITGGNRVASYDATAKTNTYGIAGLLGSDSVSAVSGIASATNAGSYADSLSGATGSGLANYDITYVNGGLTINRAGLTITGNHTVRTYDTTSRTNTYGVAGLFGSDSVSNVVGAAVGTNAGSYADALSGATGSGLSNYDITYVNGGMVVNRAGLTITGGHTSSTYDATRKINVYSVAGLLGSDSVTDVSGRAAGVNAGSYYDSLWGATGTGIGNYDITYVNGGLTVNRAGLTIAGNNDVATYDATAHGNGFSVTGLKGSDQVAAVSGLATGTRAGGYADHLSGAAGTGLSNYDITYVNGGLTVNRARLTITGDRTAITYDATARKNGYSVAGLYGNDNVARVSGSASGTDVGTYGDALWGATGSGLENYDIAYDNGGIAIFKADLLVAGNTTRKFFDGREKVNGFKVRGLLGHDRVTGVSGLASGSAIGSYSDNLFGAVGSGLFNYEISYENGALTIDEAIEAPPEHARPASCTNKARANGYTVCRFNGASEAN